MAAYMTIGGLLALLAIFATIYHMSREVDVPATNHLEER